MALLKSIEAEVGVSAIYWNIGLANEDFKSQKSDLTLYGYVSQEARQKGKQPLSVMQMQVIGVEYVAGADRAALYSIIKKRPEFDGAVDALGVDCVAAMEAEVKEQIDAQKIPVPQPVPLPWSDLELTE